MALVIFCCFAWGKLQERVRGQVRTLVVTRGCPQKLSGTTRLFVAVPSAAQNVRRRQWVRSTWCQNDLGIAVAFFVGGGAEDDMGDIVSANVWDGPDNVTAKQVETMRYFARLDATHYARVEDDVYVVLPTLLDELATGYVRPLPGPPVEVRDPLAWAFFVTEGAAHAYPSGSAFVLSASLVRAVAAADAESPLDVGAPAADSGKMKGGKGGWHEWGWSTDDAYLGLLLRLFRYQRIHDRRFHDPPGRPINGWPASPHSLAVQGLTSWEDFALLHARDFGAFNQRFVSLDHRPEGHSILWMEVDGRQRGVRLTGCDDVEDVAAHVCTTFSLDARACGALTSHLRAVCPSAATHYAKVHS